MSSNGNITTKASTAATTQRHVDSSTEKLANLNLREPAANSRYHFVIYEDPIVEAATQDSEAQMTTMHDNEFSDKENINPVEPILPVQQNEGPDNTASDIRSRLPLHPMGINRSARNRLASVRRPLSDITDFVKAENMKNAHFVKRSENSRQKK
ncbi:hypothetical protein BZA77DRAFT_297701 [Pyronema omphalodes]|nr:hypothetical protein BZA77DRAFT_297701 [Pyronema omphalodes]